MIINNLLYKFVIINKEEIYVPVRNNILLENYKVDLSKKNCTCFFLRLVTLYVQ
jgi:hypothetical protein